MISLIENGRDNLKHARTSDSLCWLPGTSVRKTGRFLRTDMPGSQHSEGHKKLSSAIPVRRGEQFEYDQRCCMFVLADPMCKFFSEPKARMEKRAWGPPARAPPPSARREHLAHGVSS